MTVQKPEIFDAMLCLRDPAMRVLDRIKRLDRDWSPAWRMMTPAASRPIRKPERNSALACSGACSLPNR